MGEEGVEEVGVVRDQDQPIRVRRLPHNIGLQVARCHRIQMLLLLHHCQHNQVGIMSSNNITIRE